MSMEDYDFLFKIVLIGNAGVGKTCLVRRFTQVRALRSLGLAFLLWPAGLGEAQRMSGWPSASLLAASSERTL